MGVLAVLHEIASSAAREAQKQSDNHFSSRFSAARWWRLIYEDQLDLVDCQPEEPPD